MSQQLIIWTFIDNLLNHYELSLYCLNRNAGKLQTSFMVQFTILVFAFSKHVVMMRFENPCIVAHRITAWLKKLRQNPFRPVNAKQACSKAVPIQKALVHMLNSNIQDVLELWKQAPSTLKVGALRLVLAKAARQPCSHRRV